MLYLLILSRYRAVGEDHTVQTEGFEIRLVTEITAIEHMVGSRSIDALVNPVPDKAASHTGMTVYLLPIFLEITQRITHTMGIFAGKHRTIIVLSHRNIQQMLPSGILRSLLVRTFGNTRIQILCLHTGIETAHDIHTGWVGLIKILLAQALRRLIRRLSTFIMHQSRWVEGMKPACHSCMIGTETALVAQAPEDDARMVLVSFCHSHGSVQKGGIPVGSRGERSTESVGLAICLVHHIDAGTIAQFIPAGNIRIMTGSDGIHVRLLHQPDIALHHLLGHHSCQLRIMLVPVHATQFDRFSVHHQLSVFYRNPSESDALLYLFHHTSLLVEKCQFQGI